MQSYGKLHPSKTSEVRRVSQDCSVNLTLEKGWLHQDRVKDMGCIVSWEMTAADSDESRSTTDLASSKICKSIIERLVGGSAWVILQKL